MWVHNALAKKKEKPLSQQRTLTEGGLHLLFVLMSVSGGIHGDFLNPFRKSPITDSIKLSVQSYLKASFQASLESIC